MSVETTYQKKTQLEHILLRPDTYVGSTEFQDQQIWVLGDDEKSFENRQIKYVPALYKIFDEILVNAADNYSRDKRMKKLDVVIDPENNMISIMNDGKGIPVQIHKEYNIFVPELIFGHLLTSSNYNDAEKKVTGGRNGYGAKLTNIFSTKFIVESADAKNKKKFIMTWTKNMSEQSDPQITSYAESDFTKITFYPDLKKFHMRELEKDIVDLMKKRVYDMAGVIGGSVKVTLNGQKIEINSFSDYTDFYLKNVEGEVVKVYDNKGTNNERWEVIASLSEGQFQQVSFVNSICTSKGGTHVNYITDQLTDKLMETLKKKEKNLNIKPFQVKSHMWIFVKCLIENPSFDSQTKETLTIRPQDFGSVCEISEKFIKDLIKSNIINHILLQAKAKEQAKMAKTLQGKKQSRLLGVPKLEDANDAGTRNAESCTLIVTEGDSAKALAMSGIEVVGRDKFGVFPLKGKMLNVRDSSSKQITENLEIQNIIKIMGMKLNTNYENLKSLRYGSIMIMADQDHDGSHIKGLFINFIQNFWPSLYKTEGFLKEFITPIVKVKKGTQAISFFSIYDFRKWQSTCTNSHLWTAKYYKGLGTSTDQEAQEYFGSVQKHTINFRYNGQEDDDSIDLAFNKKRAEDRKQWLVKYDPEENVDHSQKHLSYKDFVHKELINFSITDNARSIPSICDGLKPGQRKILYACFKRNLKNEIKVAQLSGYVAEHSAYHHGEASLAQTITGMAQNFVGSNNINYLLPIGQFGSRNMGGKEAASARYIHTALNKITRCIFPEHDDHILTYLEDDGQTVEPIFYIPIIPTSLLNGAEGIGTGWSTSIPCYNPRELVDSIEKRMMGVPFSDLLPWYKVFNHVIYAKGFTGDITNNEKSQITVKGRFHIIDENTIEITELPINKWIRDFKNFLEEKLESTKEKEQELEDIKEYHAGNRVHFVIKMNDKQMEKIQKEGFEKYFKLTSTIPTTNMVLFNAEGKITRYANTIEIMEEFYEVRLNAYNRRKDFLVSKISRELEILSNKKRFILAVINEELRVRNAKRKDLVRELSVKGFVQWKDMTKIKTTKGLANAHASPVDESEGIADEFVPINANDINPKEYHYLLSLPIWNLTFEKVEEIKTQQKLKQDELDKLTSTDIIDIWKEDLNKFVACLDEIEEEEEKEMLSRLNKGRAKGKQTALSSKRKKPAQKKKSDSDEEMDIENINDNGSDYEVNKKAKLKKNGSSAPVSQVKGKTPIVEPTISQETGISSKFNKNNQSIVGFVNQAQPIKAKVVAEIKKPIDPLQNTLDKYSFKKDTQSQKAEELNTQTSVLSQNYSLSLEERLKLKFNGCNIKLIKIFQEVNFYKANTIGEVQSQSQSQKQFSQSRQEVEEKKPYEDEDYKDFDQECSQKKQDVEEEDIYDNLDYLDELIGNGKRHGSELIKVEPKIEKKRISIINSKKVAQPKISIKQLSESNDDIDSSVSEISEEGLKKSQKKKPLVSKGKKGSSLGRAKKQSSNSESDFDSSASEISDEDVKKSSKNKPVISKGKKGSSQGLGRAKKQTSGSEDDFDSSASEISDEDVIRPSKKKPVVSKGKKGSQGLAQTKPKNKISSPLGFDIKITNSEDEDIQALKDNQVFESRTRGKRNVIPRRMLVDDSDNDDFDSNKDKDSQSEDDSPKVQIKKIQKGKKPKKVNESSDENYF